MAEPWPHDASVPQGIAAFTDADSIRTMQRALRFLLIMTALGAGLAWWKLGWQSAVLLVVGAAISGSGLWEWTRLMKALLFEVSPNDPATLAGVTALITVVAAAASLLPAVRATSVDPIVALRDE